MNPRYPNFIRQLCFLIYVNPRYPNVIRQLCFLIYVNPRHPNVIRQLCFLIYELLKIKNQHFIREFWRNVQPR